MVQAFGGERDAKDLLPEGFTHPGSPNGEFKKRNRYHGRLV